LQKYIDFELYRNDICFGLHSFFGHNFREKGLLYVYILIGLDRKILPLPRER